MRFAANLRKRRGVIRASITRLGKSLIDLQSAPDKPGVSESANQLAVKLEGTVAKFSISFKVRVS
jgi:hypothetical protein